jgi:RNA polymerase sigma factor (sigma-70 family)
MVVNEYLSWQRRAKRHAPLDDEPGAPVPDGAAERAERAAMIHLLDRLPRRQRAAVVLRYYAGLSHEEVAAELGCRASTVRSQISRALAALRIDINDTAGAYPAPTVLEIR